MNANTESQTHSTPDDICREAGAVAAAFQRHLVALEHFAVDTNAALIAFAGRLNIMEDAWKYLADYCNELEEHEQRLTELIEEISGNRSN